MSELKFCRCDDVALLQYERKTVRVDYQELSQFCADNNVLVMQYGTLGYIRATDATLLLLLLRFDVLGA